MSVRYHAISIVAVFLALAAGMVIGALFLQSPALNTTRNLISGLRVQAAQQRTDLNSALVRRQDTRDQLMRFSDMIAPRVEPVVRGSINERRVAIIQVGDYPDATAAVASAVQMAGGVVSVTITLDPTVMTADDQRKAVSLLSRLGSRMEPNELKALNGATVSQPNLAVPPTRLVVIVGGHKLAPSGPQPSLELESSIIDALRPDSSVRIVGVEPLEADLSSVSAYAAKDIPSVDCIDLPAGQIALPFTLSGESGAFGLKKTAEALLPEPAFAALFTPGPAGG